MHTELHYVAALDLSKTDTGLAIGVADLRDRTLRIESWHKIRPPVGAAATRWLFAPVDAVVEGIARHLQAQPGFQAGRCTIAVEANVWSETSSELQFHLGQSLLRWAEGCGIDCVAYNPQTVKSWVRRWAKAELPKRLGGKVGKAILEQVWRNDLRTRAPDLFPSSLNATDDQVDAGWIALLALYAHVPYLPLDDQPLLVSEGDLFRAAFMKGKLQPFANLPSPDLSSIYTNMRSNKHLSLLSDSFYPFRQLKLLANHIGQEFRHRPDETLTWLLTRTRTGLSRRSMGELLEGGKFLCSLDGGAKLLLRPEVNTPV